jgi:hypothetical protein
MSAERIPVPLSTCYRLLNHGPTVMVSSAHGGKANVMSAAWSMPITDAEHEQPHRNQYTDKRIPSVANMIAKIPAKNARQIQFVTG